ncbi:MAG: ribbon-helix-helix protein, CopG family [Rhodocyclaceae bacterium]|nr:ribbon-helix-helix protein, CopG family [Rhodocyclaceae bacterium]
METTLLCPVSLKLEQAEHERLKSLADARNRKPHFLMKEAIRQYLDREEARESFKQEALASWQAYQETGQHLTGGEVVSGGVNP